jgi:hypothetical protein
VRVAIVADGPASPAAGGLELGLELELAAEVVRRAGGRLRRLEGEGRGGWEVELALAG